VVSRLVIWVLLLVLLWAALLLLLATFGLVLVAHRLLASSALTAVARSLSLSPLVILGLALAALPQLVSSAWNVVSLSPQLLLLRVGSAPAALSTRVSSALSAVARSLQMLLCTLATSAAGILLTLRILLSSALSAATVSTRTTLSNLSLNNELRLVSSRSFSYI
jgi:hypothetical protein